MFRFLKLQVKYRKYLAFLLSLVFATLAWLLLQNNRNQNKTLIIPIEYASSLKIYQRDTIKVILQAPIWSSWGQNNPNTISKIHISRRSIKHPAFLLGSEIVSKNIKNTLGMRIISVSPDTIFLKTGHESISYANIPVSVCSKITCISPYSIDKGILFYPKTISISGMSSDVKKIKSLQTVTLTLNNLCQIFSDSIPISTDGLGNVLIAPQKVKVFVPVSLHTEKELVVPIKVQSNYGNRIKVIPNTAIITINTDIKDFDYINHYSLHTYVKASEALHSNSHKLRVYASSLPRKYKIVSIRPKFVSYLVYK